jgi:hypothetical protein
MIKTASWYTRLPKGHIKIGISRGTPRRIPAGSRIYRKLAPGPWFNSTSSPQEYERLYRAEVLAPLDPRQVAAELDELVRGMIPVIVCFERVNNPKGDWCHRALAAEWLAEGLGQAVPELGYETLAQHQHPLMHDELRQKIELP